MTFTAILSDFAQSLLALALPILAAYLAQSLRAWLEQAVASMRSRANVETRYLLDDAALIAVRAAEQLGGASSQKIDYALRLAQKYLAEHNVAVDPLVLRGLVEAAVKAEFGKRAAPPPPYAPVPDLRIFGNDVTVTPVITSSPAPTGREIE